MTSQSQVERIATDAFRALRAKARDERGSDTQPIDFIDPLLPDEEKRLSHWDPLELTWVRRPPG